MIPIYNSSAENYLDLLQAITEQGYVTQPRGLKISELICEQLFISKNNVLMNCPGIRNVTNEKTKEGQYLRAEFVWYMSGSLKTNFISQYGKMWEKLGNEFNDKNELNGDINSNYGYQVFQKPVTEFLHILVGKNNIGTAKSSFEWVVDEFNRDPDTRKAIIQYTWPVIYMEGVKDFTCTQTQHFLYREKQLFNLVHIRSSDAIKGLTFDIPWWDFVGQCVARKLNFEYNKMRVIIGSSHIYSNDMPLVEKLLDSETFNFDSMILRSDADIKSKLLDVILKIEDLLTDENDLKLLNSIITTPYKNDNIDFIYALILLCGFYVTNKKLTESKSIMDDLNNRIFDAVFEY